MNRILVVTNNFPSPAAPHNFIFALRQIQALQELGNTFAALRVIPFAPPLNDRWRSYRNLPRRYEYEGVPVEIVRAIVPPRLFALPLVRAQVGKALKESAGFFNAELLHAQGLLPAAFLATGWGMPVVITAHGGDAYETPFERRDLLAAAHRALRGAARVVAVSRFVRSSLERLGCLDADVIYNGADERIFFPKSREESRRALQISPDRFVVAFVGNIVKAKGVFELAEALAALADLRPYLVVAGGGPAAAEFSDRLRDAGIETRFMGVLNQRALPDIYGAADAVALPSHKEGLPCTLCETMLCGRVMVATPVGGIPEVLEAARTGMIVPARDPKALALALRTLHGDPVMRDGIERAARAFAERSLTWRENAKAYERIYQSVEGGR
ncbi:MAG: glycosyltransferase [Candidatus Cybelea sp.]